MRGKPSSSLVPIELNAVIVAVSDNTPFILTTSERALPSGPFESEHRTLEQGLRAWAERKGAPKLGYVEQLYTFADRDRTTQGERSVSIGYLALIHDANENLTDAWSSWYAHLPWEDCRDGPHPIIASLLRPALLAWKNTAVDAATKRARAARLNIAFPTDARQWNEELVLQRYELLWEAELVREANPNTQHLMGIAMPFDHRRILATAIARLRAKIKYRPVVFELLPPHFTLGQLQTTVEALAGIRLHKQNFRRLVQAQGLVEETGTVARDTSRRPAKLFAFRPKVLEERAAAGTKLPRS